jgi:hypothetical protein
MLLLHGLLMQSVPCVTVVDMSSLGIKIRPGLSIFDPVVSGAQKAVLSKELEIGQTFPSGTPKIDDLGKLL